MANYIATIGSQRVHAINETNGNMREWLHRTIIQRFSIVPLCRSAVSIQSKVKGLTFASAGRLGIGIRLEMGLSASASQLGGRKYLQESKSTRYQAECFLKNKRYRRLNI